MPIRNVRQQKNELRAKYKKIRKECPPEIKIGLDKKITEKFLSLEDYISCKTLFTFVSSDIEVDTTQIIKRALADGKNVAVPKCTDKTGHMDFYYINSLDDLKTGYFSILEPDVEICKKAEELTGLCIVPGLCFDYEGYRIGFGKGYYDRFLQKFKGATVGICYSKCIEKELPKGAYDKSVDIIVTDKFTIQNINKE